MFKERVFLPTAGVGTPLTNFDWSGHRMAVQQDVEPFPSDRLVSVAASSFGIGGSYGHIILREWKVGSDTNPDRQSC
jgi:acyl transferase domain-containing protein